MASTVNRSTWVNDTGTFASPNNDGTPITNAELQEIYNNIDEFIARASKTWGGVHTWETLGTHNFTAGGTGANVLTVRNTAPGTGNAAEISVGNDSGVRRAGLQMLSSTFTPSGHQFADGAALFSGGTGGLSIAATQASGVIRLYAGTTSVTRMLIDNSGGIRIGTDTSLDSHARVQVSAGSDNTNWTLTLHHASTGGASSGRAGINFRIDATDVWQFYVNNADSNALVLDYLGTPKLRFSPSTGQLQLSAGTAAAPALSFIGDADNGVYLSGTNEVAIATDGTQRMRWTSGGNCVLAGGQHLAPNGSAGSPSHSFSNATGAGMYLTTGPDVVRFAVGGSSIAEISASGIQTSVNVGGAQTISVSGGALGTGNVRGGQLGARRNNSGSGAAGSLVLEERGGNLAALWVESGNLRISAPGSAPLENDSVSHTGGVVVGTQTSSRDAKTRIRRMRDVNAALRTVLDTPIFRWRYRKGRGIQNEDFIGVITDESPMFGMDRDESHPHGRSLNVANAVGLLVAAMQAQQRTIDALQQQVLELGRAA